MQGKVDRRDFLKLAGLGGAVFVSGLAGGAATGGPAKEDFYFVQLSDTHWGFQGPVVNPDAGGTLHKAVAAVNDLRIEPDFIMFTGDLTHTTDDPAERRRRLAGFRDIVSGLKNGNVRFIPGEHDAALDNGQAWKEFFGPSFYSFDHKGVHFITIDNVSDPAASISSRGSRPTSRCRRTMRASSCSRTGRSSTCIRSGTGRRATGRRRSNCSCLTATSRCSTVTFTRKTTT